MEKRFKVLRIISVIYKAMSVFVLVVGIAFSVILPVSTSQSLTARMGAFFATFFVTVFYALLLYALGELITLGLAIEENTRESRDLLSRQPKEV